MKLSTACFYMERLIETKVLSLRLGHQDAERQWLCPAAPTDLLQDSLLNKIKSHPPDAESELHPPDDRSDRPISDWGLFRTSAYSP